MEKVLEFLASSFEVSRHLEFYLIWTQKLLLAHGQKLKSRYCVLTCVRLCLLSQLLFVDKNSDMQTWHGVRPLQTRRGGPDPQARRRERLAGLP